MLFQSLLFIIQCLLPLVFNATAICWTVKAYLLSGAFMLDFQRSWSNGFIKMSLFFHLKDKTHRCCPYTTLCLSSYHLLLTDSLTLQSVSWGHPNVFRSLPESLNVTQPFSPSFPSSLILWALDIRWNPPSTVSSFCRVTALELSFRL